MRQHARYHPLLPRRIAANRKSIALIASTVSLLLPLACLRGLAYGGQVGDKTVRGPVQSTPKTGGVTIETPADVRVEYFGPAHGYTVGTADVEMLCVVRNVGSIPLPDRQLRLRCYVLAGLDYTTGETAPFLPALAPNQAVAFRWRLTPSENSGPMVVAALVKDAGATLPAPGSIGIPGNTGGKGPHTTVFDALEAAAQEANGTSLAASRAFLAVVPRLNAEPSWGGVPTLSQPGAWIRGTQAGIGNDRVVVRFVPAQGGVPLLLLAAKVGNGWQTVATGVPLLRMRAGEDGQLPWWETFRWKTSRIHTEKDAAWLTLEGTLGERWRAEMTLEARRDTCVLNGRLRLTSQKMLRLFGVQLPRLLAAASTGLPSVANGMAFPVVNRDSPLPADARLAADLQKRVVFGLTWPSEAPLPGFRWNRLPSSSITPVLGAQWESEERGELVSRGATLEFPFRLFALTPSDTVRDAARFILP